MKILITGGNGYVAKSLLKGLKGDYEVFSVNRQSFDLSRFSSVHDWFSKNDKYYDTIIHTAITGGNRLEEDGSKTVDQNLKMYYNLLSCRDYYGKFINFGSGAEIHAPNTPYGLSKKAIAESIIEKENFFNLRIFAAFDENELNRRFIKANIINYINKDPITLHSNKAMDFFYMKDLVSLVKYYIENNTPPKQIDCCYQESKTLLQIANHINTLSSYEVPTNKSTTQESSYCGSYLDLGIPYIGLEKGIKEVYEKLS